MNVLILTGRFGMGHIRCAEALKECMLTQTGGAVNVETVDLLEYLFPRAARQIYAGFGKFVSFCPDLYNRLNLLAGENENSLPFRKVCCEKMSVLMRRYRPDLVIANLPLCVQFFSLFKEQTGDRTPLYVYVTDITFHREWVAPRANLYFVGDTVTQKAILAQGVAAKDVHITGIPVSGAFRAPQVRGEGRRQILVMGGGLGILPGGTETLEILHCLREADVTLVCGTNQKLRRLAEERYPDFRILGCTDRVPQLMRQADVLITKPGGITTFEAIRSELPLLCIAPTLEQELGNASFIERHGFGKIVYEKSDFTAEGLAAFLRDGELAEMRRNMRQYLAATEPQNPLFYFARTAS